jgi:dihydrofolate synthase/folylpolyglutamate synthase
MMNYPDSVRFLYALGNEIKTAKLGLDRIRAVLAALGDPQDSFRVFHVAGTKAQFERAFSAVHGTVEALGLDMHPTYFETVTAMGFWLFRELGVVTAVVEVGLGGRLDATNVVHPALTVITPIDYDHEAYLGGTIEAIAGEKAGILKPGVPAIFARQRPEAQAVLDQRAAELGVPVRRTSEFAITGLHITARGSEFSGLRCPLAGEHQIENAITAAMALEALGVPAQGIEHAFWPGRLEHISPNPDIILDGAHNPAGARALAAYLERFYANRKLWMIYGAMRDKAVDEIAGALFPLATELVLTAPDNARALRPEALRELAGRGRIAPNIAAAVRLVREEITEHDALIITGSLFLVGEARALSYNKRSWPFSGAWSS